MTKYVLQSAKFLFLFLFFNNLNAEITGVVFDMETNQRLYGVNVKMNGNYTVTDKNGFFKLNNLIIDTLEISSVGYLTLNLIPKLENEFIQIRLQPAYNEIQEIKITALNYPEKLRFLPGNISILKLSNKIINDNISLLSEINNVSGIQVHSGAFNTNRIVIRGMGSRTQYATDAVKAYINEIPVTEADGLTALEDFDPLFFSRIEIVKGPVSSVYGSGLGGVIRLNTQGNSLKSKLNVSTQFGSFGSNKQNILASIAKEKFLVNVGFANVYSKGYRENSSFYHRSVFLNPAFTGKSLTIQGLFLYTGVKAYIASSLNQKDYLENPEKAAGSWNAIKGFEDYSRFVNGINLIYNFAGNWYLNTSLFYNYTDDYEKRPFNTQTDKGFLTGNKTFFSYLNKKYYINTGWEYLTGSGNVNLFETLQTGQGMLLNKYKDQKTYLNYFLLIRSLFFEKFKYFLSFNVTKTKYQFNADTILNKKSIEFPLTFSPRFGINYQIGKQSNLYMSLSHGFSTPSFDESINVSGIFNENIKPEKGWMTETGIRGMVFKNKVYFDCLWYNMFINNLITIDRISEDIFYNINAGKTFHGGLESNIRMIFFKKSDKRNWNLRSEFNFDYSINKFTKFIYIDEDYSGNNLPGIPDYNFYGKINYEYKEWYVQSEYKRIGSMFLTDNNIGFIKTYSLINIQLGNSMSVHKLKISITAGISNLLNTKYASMILINAPSLGNNEPRYYYPGLPRTYSVGLSIDY